MARLRGEVMTLRLITKRNIYDYAGHKIASKYYYKGSDGKRYMQYYYYNNYNTGGTFSELKEYKK